MKFTKMHGCGNDFVIVDGPADLTAARVRDLCDRRRGIGADGVLVIGEARGRCWRVTIHNADGSMGESCGTARGAWHGIFSTVTAAMSWSFPLRAAT